jgi:gamma-tubulin complex component 5
VYLDELRHPPPPPGTLSWADIFAAEPLTGQHWAGAYGLPPGARADADDDNDSSSDASSVLERELELDLTPPDSDSDTASSADGEEPLPDVTARVHEAYAHRKAVEALERRQYWRADAKNGQAARAFDLGDPSTLG